MTNKDIQAELDRMRAGGELRLDTDLCLSLGRSCAAYNLRRASRLVTQAFDQALKPVGLKITQFSLLVAFLMAPGSNLAQLAKGLGMDRTTLSRNLRLLEKKGLVRTTPGKDRREQRVEITDKGKDAVRQAVPLWHQTQAQVVSTLGEDKWDDLAKDLRTMARGLK